ncbi:MAG: putative baseplate assembly protein [Proteobacteria bacterium]|nr:putative baseplate assembly protein [Pseudomonadota bacterium]
MSCTCGCCTGVRVATPAAEENRPGLRAIRHRPGGYASFLGTMHARLASTDFPQLAALRTRDAADPSIALCDGWAIAAEVLSFYQDRIANEGYLRTATERNSILQLGRLTGYEMRPGVSASAYLVYTVDANASPVTIAVGTRVQSVPAAGEKMQTFETAEALDARPEWSQIKVRMAQPQWRAAPPSVDPATGTVTSPQYATQYDALQTGLYLDGTSTQLKPNDALLIDYGSGAPTAYRIDAVTPQPDDKRTWVQLRGWNSPAETTPLARTASRAGQERGLTPAQALLASLTKPLTAQPRNALVVPRSAAAMLQQGGEFHSKALLAHLPMLADTLVPGLRSVNMVAAEPSPIKVYALRLKAALFGNAAPGRYVKSLIGGAPPTIDYGDLSLAIVLGTDGIPKTTTDLPLDAKYESIKPGSGAAPSWVVVDPGVAVGGSPAPATVHAVLDNQAVTGSIGAVISAQISRLTVDSNWLPGTAHGDVHWLDVLRNTRIYAQSEELTPASDPLQGDVAGNTVDTDEIELDQYYDGLVPGLWVIAGGERADLTLGNGAQDKQTEVQVAERAMIASVRHGLTALTPLDASGKPLPGAAANLPGDTLHTFVKLAAPLAYTYKRATFTIYGNVVRATHGQTTKETLGSGDATQIFQQFALKAPPLTRVSAPTPDGVASTLQVRVNQLLWHETDDLAGEDASARAYRTRRDDSEATSIMFGDGNHGARLPTGQDNVAAVYRSGIGAGGNVRAGQLTVLADKPLGASAVTNPIRASGGADADTLAQARVNAPLSVTALDRLVSVRDYADFASTFAGIGKATAIKLPGPGGDFVEVTVAGIDDAPIDASSDLYRNLVEALHAFGDPHLPIRVDIRDALALVIEARVALRPDYDWNDVQPRIVAALNGAFGFQARGLGQPVFASEVIAAIQSVRGVAHVAGGSVHLLDDGDLIAGLAPASPTATPTPAASVPPSSAAAGAAEKSPPWFALVPEPGAGDEGAGANGWLAVPAATAHTAADGTLKVSPAQIAYLPANVPEALILELAS